MNKIDMIFGGGAVAAIVGIGATVYFGAGVASDRTFVAASAGTTVNLLGDDEDDYEAPVEACSCYYMAYDLVRDGFYEPAAAGDQLMGAHYESQLQVCYDRLGAVGAAAFDDGASDAVGQPYRDRPQRRSCQASRYK